MGLVGFGNKTNKHKKAHTQSFESCFNVITPLFHKISRAGIHNQASLLHRGFPTKNISPGTTHTEHVEPDWWPAQGSAMFAGGTVGSCCA